MRKLEIKIPLGGVELEGNLTIPTDSRSIVIFSHGSGSSRFSPRNKFVATTLNAEKISTLLIDLLTPDEDSVYETRFNIDLLTNRLVSVTEYIQRLPETEDFRIGYFGASTGAASALKAAAKLGDQICSVVSRGGRPDLAGSDLKSIVSPVLLIVGSLDTGVIELNEEAYNELRCVKRMEIIKDATHLFEETGKLQEVAKLACIWFKKNLANTGELRKMTY